MGPGSAPVRACVVLPITPRYLRILPGGPAELLLRKCCECGEADAGLLKDDESNPGDCYCVACWEKYDRGEAIYTPGGCAVLL